MRCGACALAMLLAALLVGEAAANLEAQMSNPQEPETDEDKFVDAARHGRFQEVRELHEKGVDPNYYNDASVSDHNSHCTP